LGIETDTSRPYYKIETRGIVVKVINQLGDEATEVLRLAWRVV